MQKCSKKIFVNWEKVRFWKIRFRREFLLPNISTSRGKNCNQWFLSSFFFFNWKFWFETRRLDFYLIFKRDKQNYRINMTRLDSSQRYTTVFYDWYVWIQTDKDGGKLQQSRLEISINISDQNESDFVYLIFLCDGIHIYIYIYLSFFFFETRIKSSFFE